MIDFARLTAREGNYKFASSNAITDRTLLEIASQFDAQVSRKITALTPDQLARRYTTSEPILETTKYDGEGVFIYFDKASGACAFNAPSGRVRIGFPALEKLAAHLGAQGVQKALFRAELYLPHTDPKSRRPSVADVVRVSFNGTADEIAALRLVMLDVIMLDGRDLRPNQEKFTETWELLGRLFGTDPTAPFHRAEGSIIPERELPRVFAERTSAGSEGLVIRRLQRLEIVKVKPHLSIDAVVIGYVEGEFEGKYGVTSLLTALSYPDKDEGRTLLHTFARVGSGFTDQQREEFLGVFSSLKVAPPLAMTDSDGRAIHFVRPVHLVELHGEDLVTTTYREKENRTQLFSTDGESYRFHGLAPIPRLTFATFNKLRPDKTLATGGARIAQVDPEIARPRIASTSAEPSSIVRREVYVKGDAVRKLLLLKNNSDRAVPYMVYWTDFSAKRKDPLKVTVQCAYTEARAQALAELLIAENVTKGFVRHGAPDAAPASEPAPATVEGAAVEPKAKKPRAKKSAPPADHG